MSNLKKHIVVTGASGFVGKYVISELLKHREQYKISALVRKPFFSEQDIHEIIIPDIGDISWLDQIAGEIDCIVHIAGLAHNKFGNHANDLLTYFRKVNTEPTKKLVEAADVKKVKRFIFISSIGVVGSSTKQGVFNDFTHPSPSANYAISKYEAENEIKKVCEKIDCVTNFVIIRPPLVYGYDAPGNFSKLLKLIRLGLPLPLLSVRNRRSFIGCHNLANFIVHSISHENAANQTFLIADNENISTQELVRSLSLGMRSKTKLFYFPVSLLKLAFLLLGKKTLYEQLCCSLEVDSSRAKKLLQWNPRYETQQALMESAAIFEKSH